jgi:hypothetical protein
MPVAAGSRDHRQPGRKGCSQPTAFRTLPVQRAVRIERTRYATAKSRRGAKETVREREDKREDKATVSERDKLLDRKMLSICRGC